MDWYLDGDDAQAVASLRREVTEFLRRHAEGGDVDDAELVVAEVLGNALRHAGGPSWVTLSWTGASPTMTVYDLGPGFDPATLDPGLPELEDLAPFDETLLHESGRGLFLISHLAAEVHTHTRTEGMEVTVTLPVTRAAQTSHDPPRTTIGSLPALDEARPEGGFGKESFLRALVVQLAQTLERQHGPDAAEAAVAQVGADVGGQMEAEYRAAEDIVGRMTPQQMAHCYVRLKHAIDGGFYVIEADEDKVVLGNTRCPFGEAVRRAPSLCRMTSSVFGGIAARNSDEPIAVLLEERIAVGDPGCRVVVYLREPAGEASTMVHRYAPPRLDD
ncbi:MAG TPA: ATP-binding protein [Nocardioidaceae bacterium]|nr:ATP-binding protein [Nocardioidaceae bacterium]